MRIAFMGTPEFAVPALREILEDGHDVAAVYTRPPAPRGRGHVLTPSPVHAFAESQGLEVRTPRSFRHAETLEPFRKLALDAAVVVAYGQILPKEVLEAPRLGCWNLHASLLPRWRGAAPIQRAIMAGDTETGVQVIRMTEGLDEGPILVSERVAIARDDTAGTLHDKLAPLGAALLTGALRVLERGGAPPRPQPFEGLIYARKVSPAEARIDWARTAAEVDRHIRGLSPHPGAWFEALTPKGPIRVKALMSQTAAGAGSPGEVLDGDDFRVACGQAAVRLIKVQREGGKPQDGAEFLRGLTMSPQLG
jgi:methionyl-tRNA formyltransferase